MSLGDEGMVSVARVILGIAYTTRATVSSNKMEQRVECILSIAAAETNLQAILISLEAKINLNWICSRRPAVFR